MEQKATAPFLSSEQKVNCLLVYILYFIHIFTEMSKVRIKFENQKRTEVLSIDNMYLICWRCAPCVKANPTCWTSQACTADQIYNIVI